MLKRFPDEADFIEDGMQDNDGAESPASTAAMPAGQPDDFDMEEGTPRAKKRGWLSSIYNACTWERTKDVAAGMAVSGAARYLVIGGGMAVGLSGLPIVFGSAIVAGVARTAWTIHKERKAYSAQTGENISFWDWATKKDDVEGGLNNKAKYTRMLGLSTAFATLGTTFMTYAMPHIEHAAAAIFDRVAKSETFAAVSAAIGGFFSRDLVDAAPTPPAKPDAETIRRGMEAWDKMIAEKGLSGPAAPAPDAVAPGAAVPATPELPDAAPSTAPAVVAPVSLSDKISGLAHDDLSQRWEGVLARAVDGNAQAQKDIASAVLNGTHGFDKNPAAAADLYRAAADAGNVQARADLAFMQYHGLGGIKADPKAALSTLRDQADGNSYMRNVLNTLTGRPSISETLQRVVEPTPVPVSAINNLPLTIVTPAPGDEIVTAPVAAVDARIPDSAALRVTWTQNAEGAIEGKIKPEDVPAWLQDGMKFGVPTAQVR